MGSNPIRSTKGKLAATLDIRRGGETGKHDCSYPIFLLMEKNGVEGGRSPKTYGFESRPCQIETFPGFSKDEVP